MPLHAYVPFDSAGKPSIAQRKIRYIHRAIFRKSTGMTILGFRELQRINEAKQMLSTSLFSQKEIAYELGYHDVYHFSKAFKKITGFTPGKYEKQG